MTNTDKVQESIPESLTVMTDSEQCKPTDSPAILTALNEEEQQQDAVDEIIKDKSAQDLSQVITALQEETQAPSQVNGDSQEAVDLTAPSEPNSPRPKPSSLLFENIKTSIDVPEGQNMADFVTPPTPGVAPPSFLASDNEEEEAGKTSAEIPQVSEPAPAVTTDNGAAIDDTDVAFATAAAAAAVAAAANTEGTAAAPVLPSNSNTISVFNIDFENVRPNFLSPRAQEKYDEDMKAGMDHFFNNKFSQAKTIFEKRAKDDPLYSLGLSSMSFIKAITSYNPKDVEGALSQLTETYLFANAQVDIAAANKPIGDAISHYFTNLIGSNSTHLPTKTRPLTKYERQEQTFFPNGSLRAHVIKAECGLLMAIIYLSMETMVGYLKAGLNLRRAYNSYSLVWQEYKRMGQDFNKYMDRDTISAIQFGIGSVHLLLSSLPPKILKIVSAFGWSADKHLGFALLKLCLEGKRIRSPLASLMLLSYYVTLASYAPQVLTRELIQPAIECLLDAQQTYPNSAFFLYFAGRVSRLARNLPLSTQSFVYTFEVSQGDWAETTIGNLATFEIAFNSAMGLDWTSAAVRALELQTKYNSPAFLKYFYGACMEMMGNRTEAILSFAEAPGLVDRKRNSQPELFVANRVAFFEISGYQDLDFSLPALEILFTWNAFPCMAPETLEKCLELIEHTLELIYEREKLEYDIRTVELVPVTATPDYYDQRGTLLLMKASIYNALNRYTEGIVHINWIIDNKEKFKHSNWIVPFAYWESGNICWGTEEFKRARALWESTLTYSGFDFEYRLATRLNLAIQHAIDLGVPETVVPKVDKGKTTHGRKRMSIVPSKSTGSIITS
ncbi:hypothetical protein INT47_005731 [Mucor saturninus]|uniref:Tetratricopeptide repeat protein 39B n=1 Tax=Mucor saturninus TaxID=64648 RepID=A0A8H7UUH5_9FUNG|nr:hypothetical protein INT47_005731 [Mucor saturninus]